MSFSVVKLEHIQNENIKLIVFGYIRLAQALFPSLPFYNIVPSITRIILTYYYAPALMPGVYTMHSTEPRTKYHPDSDPWTATYSLKIDHNGTITGTRQETTAGFQYNDKIEGHVDYDGNISKQKQVTGTWDCAQVEHGIVLRYFYKQLVGFIRFKK
eukprot:412295_1